MVQGRVRALDVVAGRLRCPHCCSRLSVRDGNLACERGHGYDVARQGHVSLFAPTGPPSTADTAAMVAARAAFLGAGHYASIARAVGDAAERALPAGADPGGGASGLVVDVGAGTGYHLAEVVDRRPGVYGLALDASRDALRRAIRAHPRIAAVACDVWRPLPVGDGTADLVLNVFAPRAAGEIARILAPGGAVVVATPGPRHLEELIERLGMLAVGGEKQERLHDAFAPQLVPDSARGVEFPMRLTRDDARALVAMGPSAHHLTPEELEERLARLADPVTVTASVVVDTFRRP